MNQRKNEVFEVPNTFESMKGAPPSAGGVDFDVQIVEVPLPSNGKVYPENHPFFMKESVMISQMTTRQENILTNRSLAKNGTLMTHLIKSVLQDHRVDPRMLLSADRNTIMISLRVSGYGPEYKVKLKCSNCGVHYDNEFDLAEMPVKRLEIDPISPGQNLFEFQLPSSKALVQFKFLNGADEEEITLSRSKKKNVGLGGDSDLITQGLMKSIVAINGETDRSLIFKIINNMLAFDSRALRKYIQDNEPGMSMEAWTECPHCGHEEEVDVPVGASFFWPDA